ncbi:MAG: hypothetical protein ACLTTU_06995 [Bilophila wadsworthia]
MLLERIPADVLPIPLLGIARPSGHGNDRRGPREHGHGQEAHPEVLSPPTRNGPSVSGRSWNASASCGSGPGCACGRGRLPHLRPDSGARERLRLRHAQRGVPCRHSGQALPDYVMGKPLPPDGAIFRAVPVRRRQLGISGSAASSPHAEAPNK